VKKAFVLGAGFGTRLRPMTNVLPKPLIPVVNKPLLSYAFDGLLQAGVNQFLVNTHHLSECYAKTYPEDEYRGAELQFIREQPEILDTGGGIANIAPFVKEEPFWVCNGDILTDLPLTKVAERHRSSGNLVTLVLRSEGPQASGAWDEGTGRVRDLRNALGTDETHLFQFAGLYLVSPEFLSFLTPEPQSVVPAFLRLIHEQDRLGGILVDEGEWWDVGNRAAYLDANRALLRGGGSFDTLPRIHPGAELASSAEIDDFTVVGGDCSVGDGVRLHQSILWPGARVAPGAELERCILTGIHPPVSGAHRDRDFEDALDHETILELTRQHLPQIGGIPFRIEEIQRGGSERRYFRLRPDIQSFIFCQYNSENVDNSRFAQHTDYLAAHGVPVPRIWARDPKHQRLWIEDLGSRDLWSYRESDWRVIRRPLYESSIRAVARIHALRKDELPESDRPPLGPEFDESLYRWEQEYFWEHFAANFSSASSADLSAVRNDPSLAELAGELASRPRCLIHRDFQSQNIIVRDGSPVFIDYQGLRFGLGEYDLASLIFDPYVPLSYEERDELIGFAETLSDSLEFRETLARCACQRLMQALGAYGFLGLVKEKRAFLHHIRPAVRNLQDVAVDGGILPVLAPVLALREFE